MSGDYTYVVDGTELATLDNMTVANLRKYNVVIDGNVTHYVQVGFRGKTRDRTRYGEVLKWSHSDQIKIFDISD